MSEKNPRQSAVEKLLQQDEVVSSFQFKEFRMSLEESIERLEDRARRVHWYAIISLGIFLACAVLGPVLFSYLPVKEYNWSLMVWSGCGLVALFVTGVLAAVDHYKYRPALKREKRDLLWSAIDQLQHDVAKLSEQLKKGS